MLVIGKRISLESVSQHTILLSHFLYQGVYFTMFIVYNYLRLTSCYIRLEIKEVGCHLRFKIREVKKTQRANLCANN